MWSALSTTAMEYLCLRFCYVPVCFGYVLVFAHVCLDPYINEKGNIKLRIVAHYFLILVLELTCCTLTLILSLGRNKLFKSIAHEARNFLTSEKCWGFKTAKKTEAPRWMDLQEAKRKQEDTKVLKVTKYLIVHKIRWFSLHWTVYTMNSRSYNMLKQCRSK